MPNYKEINADQLDADLTIVADAIRAKAGISDKLPFPYGLKSAVEAIESGGVQEALVKQVLNKTVAEIDPALIEDMTSVPSYGFAGYFRLKKLTFKSATEIREFAFVNDEMLSVVEFFRSISIMQHAFASMPRDYVAVILRDNKASYITDNYINNGNLICTFFVPSALLATYQGRAPEHADKFIGLEEYTLDGTATGELDEDKIHDFLTPTTYEISFIVIDAVTGEGFQYSAVNGFAWGDFIYSDYNDGQFSYDDGYVYFNGSTLFDFDDEWNLYQVSVNDPIRETQYAFNM